ncbi:hypothetical protein Y032_0043g894 [Ancylostoma ceylanicum]|uniref:Uncharacterized protein n=1 Tax=Ancylostoma ceylanicum TaxID=53326 RepID=A0A016UFP0_9BILA|nr:hypothetical protein Y032_0043g894 [Ancylostoma ceylanicum]
MRATTKVLSRNRTISGNRAALASEGEARPAHRSSPSGQYQLSRRGQQYRLVLLKGAADLTLYCEWKIDGYSAALGADKSVSACKELRDREDFRNSNQRGKWGLA